MTKSISLFHSPKLSYVRGWTIERLKRVFLLEKRPIPVYRPIDERIVQLEIDRVFQDETARAQLLQEIEQCISIAEDGVTDQGIFTPDEQHAIVLTDYAHSPNFVKLVGIIREYAFRNIGGGTADIDLDELDYSSSMRQMIIVDLQAWQRRDLLRVIYGAYRYKICRTREDYLAGSMGKFFDFSEKYTCEPRGELGRSLINPAYRGKSFDPVYFGLAYIKVIFPDLVGFFGKITLYKQYELMGADTYLLGVAKKYWNGHERDLVQVKPELRIEEDELEDDPSLKKSLLRALHANLWRKFFLGVPRIGAIYDRIIGLYNISYHGAFRHMGFGESAEIGVSVHFAYIKVAIYTDFINPILKKRSLLLVRRHPS